MDKSNDGRGTGNVFSREKSYSPPVYPNWKRDVIVPAINSFYSTPESVALIQQNAHETEIAKEISLYIESILEKLQPTYPLLQDLSVDTGHELENITSNDACEQCFRSKCFIKKKDYDVDYIEADLVIHRRGSEEDNKVVIEFKKKSNESDNERANDIAKLIFLTCLDSNYKYNHGYFIDLGENGHNIDSYKNAELEPD